MVGGVGARSSRQLTMALTGFIYKSAVGINIMVLVVSGRGAPSSRHVTLEFHCFIYKTAERIKIMVAADGVPACGGRLGIPQTPYQHLSS